MLVQLHTKFCLLCVLTFLFQQSHRCHEQHQHKHQHNHQHNHHNHSHSDLQIPHPPHKASHPQDGDVLEEEQQFYIQQLFRRYGQRDRLDFQGFQSLLVSLGLGEVKLVEVDHEELGHDHVAHLDVLDIQDGLHSHSAHGDSHHGHSHGPHKHDPARASPEQAPTKCTSHTTAASPARKQDVGARKVAQHEHKHPHERNSGHNGGKSEGGEHKKQELHSHHGHGHDGHNHGHEDHTHEHDVGQNGRQTEVEDDQKHLHRQGTKAEAELESDHAHSHHDHDAHNHPTGQTAGATQGTEQQKQDSSQHDHEGHDHEGHDHEGHDHEGHDHEGHDHEGHDPEQDLGQNGGAIQGTEHKNQDDVALLNSQGLGSHHDHDHNHGHEGHDSGKNGSRKEVDEDHKHLHTQDNLREKVQQDLSSKNLGTDLDHDHKGHDHDTSSGLTEVGDNELQTSTIGSAGPDQQLGPSQGSPAVTEGRQRKSRKGGRGQKGRSRGQGGGDGDGHSGAHRSKREAPGGMTTPTAPALIGSTHPSGSSHQHEECLNLTQLLTYYGLSADSLISPLQFSYLCPALLYQIDSRVCIRHYHQVEVEQQALEPPNSVYVWVWGFVSITIISLLSLLGVVLVPILDQGCFKFLLTFLVALAVGTLSGDALLHLLPHSQGQHDHSADSAPELGSDLGTAFDGVWKGLTALGGIYLLFIIEHCLGMFKHYRDHKAQDGGGEDGAIGRKLSDHKLNRRSDAEWLQLRAVSEDADSSTVCDNGHNDTQLTEVQTPDSPSARTSPSATTSPSARTSPLPEQTERPSPKKNGHKAHRHGHGHSHGGNCHSDQDMKDADIASIAWMVIMGDGMHNFSDGLAIGAAFSANLTGGISTSVAVFCHELPHELGDFAVLLKAGMSVKQAIVYNVLSALMAYVGMIIGTAVGQYTHNLTSWIFAITAGMFLYVALVDMLPEMLHGDSEEHKRCDLGHFLLQNVGMLCGFAIMLLIAIFEEQIVFDFGF